MVRDSLPWTSRARERRMPLSSLELATKLAGSNEAPARPRLPLRSGQLGDHARTPVSAGAGPTGRGRALFVVRRVIYRERARREER